MSIENPYKVDAIGLDIETSRVILTITDHLEWVGSTDDHRKMLSEKLNAYLAFVEGEVYEAYPQAKGKDIVISVIGQFDLSPIGCEFFTNARETIKNAGLRLEFKRLVEQN
jgi:hypothetical protein